MNTTRAISISSNALMLLGHSSISSFEEDGIGAHVAKSFYESSYRSILNGYTWNFARKQVLLSKMDEIPDDERWKYSYQLPTDHIRTITTYPHSDYVIVKDKIYSNTDKLQLEFIYRVDESFLPPIFREAFELYLAAKWAIPVTENATNAGLYFKQHTLTLNKAKTIDSLEKPNRGSSEVAALPYRMRRAGGRY